jgi:phosphoserine aminotransferase
MRKDLVEAGNKNLATMLQYRTHAENESMYNTPPTFGIYLMMLVFRWIKAQGGLAAMETRNKAKAAVLYDYLKTSSLFKSTAKPGSGSHDERHVRHGQRRQRQRLRQSGRSERLQWPEGTSQRRRNASQHLQRVPTRRRSSSCAVHEGL